MSRLPLTARQVSSAGQPRLTWLPLLSRLRGEDEDARQVRRVAATVAAFLYSVLTVVAFVMAFMGSAGWVRWAGYLCLVVAVWACLVCLANREGQGRSGKGEFDLSTEVGRASWVASRCPMTTPPSKSGSAPTASWVDGEFVVGWSSQSPRGSALPKLTISFADDKPPTPTLLARPAVLDGHLVFSLPTMPAETPESIVVVWDETETRLAKLTNFTPPEPYPRLPLYVLREQEATRAEYYASSIFRDADEEPMTPARPAVESWWVLDGRDLWPLKEWLSWQADKVIDGYLAGRVGRGKR